MSSLLAAIRDGSFAQRWIAENETGRKQFQAYRKAERAHQVEEVGARLRAMMPFLDAVTVTPEGDVVRAAEAAGAPPATEPAKAAV